LRVPSRARKLIDEEIQFPVGVAAGPASGRCWMRAQGIAPHRD
jgi:hypothetical protein